MILQLFLLGRPGSGKSTAYRHIDEYVKRYYQGWTVKHFKDHKLLYEMFRADTEFKQFLPTIHNGFEVSELSVLDNVLKTLEKSTQAQIRAAKNDLIIAIEFARDDYRQALRLFNPEFVRHSYFLVIEADLEVCIQRIHQRVAQPETPDDHYVADHILRSYYRKDCRQYITTHLKNEYHIDVQQVKLLDNIVSPIDFAEEIYRFVELIFRRENGLLNRTCA